MPLAHLLAPQIIQRVKQVEADLGRSPRLAYTGAGARDIPSVDPRMLGPRDAAEFSYFTALTSPGVPRPFAAAARNAYNPDAQVTLIPNAKPTVQQAEPMLRKRGKIALWAEKGEPFGTTESGQPIDVRGRKLGYLTSDTGMRAADRRAADTLAEDASPNKTDTLDAKALEDRYRDHLSIYEENRGRFPGGYFKGKTKKQREAIEAGVKALQQTGPIQGFGGTPI